MGDDVNRSREADESDKNDRADEQQVDTDIPTADALRIATWPEPF